MLKASQARGAGPRDLRTALEHIEFLIEMFQGDASSGSPDQEARQALRTIVEQVTAWMP
jgi:hypothetical protein